MSSVEVSAHYDSAQTDSDSEERVSLDAEGGVELKVEPDWTPEVVHSVCLMNSILKSL